MIGQIFLAHLDHGRIDLDHGDMFDAHVLGDFTQHAAVATADDQHTLGCTVRQNRHMGEHFVVDEFVRFGGLNDAVQRHDTAHARVLEDHQVLVIGTYFVKHFFNTKALAVAFV